MTGTKQTGLPQDEQAAGRKEYIAPKIRVFGAVGALTQGGTAGMVEGNPNNMNRVMA